MKGPWGYLVRAYAQCRAALRAWTGEDDYARYVRRCRARRETPLDPGRYLAQRLEERYSTTSRCC